MPATPYVLTSTDEYGVGYAALRFDSPEHARDYLRGLLAQTDNTTIELALQAELEEVELDCEDLLRECDIIQSGGKKTNHVRDFEIRE